MFPAQAFHNRLEPRVFSLINGLFQSTILPVMKTKTADLSDIWKGHTNRRKWRATFIEEKRKLYAVFYPFSLSLCWPLITGWRDQRDECSQEGCTYKRVGQGAAQGGTIPYRRKTEGVRERVGQKRENGWYKVHTFILFFILYLYLFYSDWQCGPLGHAVDELLFDKSVQNLWWA